MNFDYILYGRYQYTVAPILRELKLNFINSQKLLLQKEMGT